MTTPMNSPKKTQRVLHVPKLVIHTIMITTHLMAAARKRSATDDDIQDDILVDVEIDENQPSQPVEAKIFITKPPTTK